MGCREHQVPKVIEDHLALLVYLATLVYLD